MLKADKLACLTSIEAGKNILITGGAGTGKSYLINKIKKLYPDTIITASTGIAAVNIGGVTIHSWSGMGYNNANYEQIVNNIMQPNMRGIRNRIKEANRLVIDEISMLSANNFMLLDYIFKIIRNNFSPFGGIKMIFVGDFLQLPPVIRNGEIDDYCFLAANWDETNIAVHELTNIYRQEDEKFIRLLKNIRLGKLEQDDIELLKMISQKSENKNINATKIFTHNFQVENINQFELHKLNTAQVTYRMETTGDIKKAEFLKKNCLASEELTLKIGARVMMLKNTYRKEGIINGSTGYIIDFDRKNFPLVEFINGKILKIKPENWEYHEQNLENEMEIKASISQIPLALAWGITVHKSQGMSLDHIECDLSKVFAPGQVYVALSRARSLEGLYIKNLHVNNIKADLRPVNFYNNLINNNVLLNQNP